MPRCEEEMKKRENLDKELGVNMEADWRVEAISQIIKVERPL